MKESPSTTNPWLQGGVIRTPTKPWPYVDLPIGFWDRLQDALEPQCTLSPSIKTTVANELYTFVVGYNPRTWSLRFHLEDAFIVVDEAAVLELRVFLKELAGRLTEVTGVLQQIDQWSDARRFAFADAAQKPRFGATRRKSLIALVRDCEKAISVAQDTIGPTRRRRGHPRSERRTRLRFRIMTMLKRHEVKLTASPNGVLARVLREIDAAADILSGTPPVGRRDTKHLKELLREHRTTSV